MKIKVTRKKILLIILTACIVLLVTLFLSFKEESNYPPVHIQRLVVKNKIANPAPRLLDSAAMVTDLAYLSSDICEGRKPGSAGHEYAVQYILSRMRQAGLDSFHQSLIQPFAGRKVNNSNQGKNVVGWIKGNKQPEKYIIVSAHYDHLGKKDNLVYYGASDNASGVGCLLGLAEYFADNPPSCSLIFAAFDREESGLEGSSFFTEHLPCSSSAIYLNLNIDMIVRNDNKEIFICGIHHYPSFLGIVRSVQPKTNASILMGHDNGSLQHDWTYQSDHYSFHKMKIPFLYVGVEDHPDYHQPGDTFDKINLSEYVENCNMVLLLINAVMKKN